MTTGSGRDALWREVAASGLTGRGGGGFPAAAKWDAVTRSGRRPLVVVNAMEGEPASAKDRALLAASPHLVLDGAELAAALCGGREIVVCVADDRDPSARAVARAVAERTAAGGGRPVTVVRPPARYVTGEESALVSWLDDGDARPVLRVDKSVPLRVGRRPVLVHNAETLAQVALIARHGAAWFRSVGNPRTPGSTLVTVSGARAHPRCPRGRTRDPGGRAGRPGGPDRPGGRLPARRVRRGVARPPRLAATPFAPARWPGGRHPRGRASSWCCPPRSCGIAETARIIR